MIPGSSIHEVYEDSLREYREADDMLNAARQDIFSGLSKQAAREFTVFHFGSFLRSDCIELPVEETGTFQREDGTVLDSQKTAAGTLIYLSAEAAVPTVVRFVPGDSPENSPNTASSFSYSSAEQKLETPHYILIWNREGRLSSLWDKDSEREVLHGEGNRLEIFEDKPLNYDAWDIDIYYKLEMNMETEDESEE